jgi:multiple sugar transport system substrate-binding protein
LKRKFSVLGIATAAFAVTASFAVTALPAHSAIPSITVWVDAPRLPGAKLYAQIMKGKVNVDVQLHAQGDLVAKVALFNRVKKGWPDVVFGPPNDVSVLQDAGDAMQLDSLATPAFWKDIAKGNNWCKGADGHYYCIKNDMAQTVLWVNTKLVKQFGYTIPKTMTDFAAIGADIAKNHPGYSLGALGDQGFYSGYLWPSQCPVNAATSSTAVRIAPKDSHCTRATSLVQPMLDSGVLSPSAGWDADFLKDYGSTDKVVMTIGPTWYGDFVIRPASSWNVPAGEITAYPMPKWAGESVAYSGEYGGGIYTVSPHSKFPKQALAFAQFMVQDKRNIVDVANPDGSHGAPTFPSTSSGNALWAAKTNADPYYSPSPFPAMLTQFPLIYTGEKPVSYDANGAWSVFSNELKKSKNAQAALEAYDAYTTNLAKQLGYDVKTN